MEEKKKVTKEDILELVGDLQKNVMKNDIVNYHNGSIHALESLRHMFIEGDYGKYIAREELINEIIPNCIQIVIEERDNLLARVNEDENVEDIAKPEKPILYN